MKAEDKAREIARGLNFSSDYPHDYKSAFDGAILMSKWKDEQFLEEKKEIDEQWKRLMAESKSIGVDLLQCKNEQHEQEKQQWIEKALIILTNWAEKHTKECDGDKFMRMGLVNDLITYFKKAMKGE